MRVRQFLAVAITLSLLFQTVTVAAAETTSQKEGKDNESTQELIIKKPDTGMVVNESPNEDDNISTFSDSDENDTGADSGRTGKAVPLSADVIQYSSLSSACKQIPCESLGGIYFLNGTKLSFYSLDTKEVTLVNTFNTYMDCYVANDKLYMLKYNGEIDVYDLLTQTVETSFQFENSASAIGADYQGRIYLAGSSDEDYMIYLLSASGELLSETASVERVYSFGGFDSSNGNFYVEGYDNWIYWGYDHDMHALRAGNVSEDTISFNETVLMYVCQAYWYERQDQVGMLGDKYFCVDSTFSSGLSIWDSDQYDPSEPSDTEVLFLERNNKESGDFDSRACVGIRTIYRDETDSVITFKNNSSIAEYDIATGEEVASTLTDYPVFSLMEYGDGIVAIEKSGDNYYYENFSWKKATEVEIISEGSSLTVGKVLQLSAETNGTLTELFTWASNNPKIASIDQQGEVFGWSEGDVIITVTTKGGLSAQYTIHVSEDDSSSLMEGGVTAVSGEESYNRSRNNYSVWSETVNSYLVQNDDGTFTRIEYVDGKIIVETYSTDGQKISSENLSMELSLFGGFYSGSDYNYFVFGQMNIEENDDAEVIRVVRYSKDFQRIDDLSVNGANTYSPFDAGSLRMTETQGKLYIHTCHEMYADSDGVHHQANMTFVINENDMSLDQSYYIVMNIAQAGYVSHSFNQYVQTDGKDLYRIDHGDAYPRGISIVKSAIDGSITNVTYTIPVLLENVTGYNPTGASVGGFELSAKNCIIAGNAVDYTLEGVDCYGNRNIFISITDKDFENSKTIWLTQYDETQGINVLTPHLIKIGGGQFLVMWEEAKNDNDALHTKMVTIDDEGNLTSEIIETEMALSDCKPIMCSDGLVRWYTTENSAPSIYAVNPLNMEPLAYTPPQPSDPVLPFIDMDRVSGSWFYDEVENVYEKNLMTGKSETIFAPYESLARAQFAVILHRIEGKPSVSYIPKFPDVRENTWYTDAVLWASDAGVITGYSDTGYFGPSDNINREQMAVMMFRYAVMKGYYTGIRADFSGFADAFKVNDFAKEAMQWAVGTGIITGKNNGTLLDPQGNASRAECAIILTRFMDYYEI